MCVCMGEGGLVYPRMPLSPLCSQVTLDLCSIVICSLATQFYWLVFFCLEEDPFPSMPLDCSLSVGCYDSPVTICQDQENLTPGLFSFSFFAFVILTTQHRTIGNFVEWYYSEDQELCMLWSSVAEN